MGSKLKDGIKSFTLTDFPQVDVKKNGIMVK
jgi:hypothetical protein